MNGEVVKWKRILNKYKERNGGKIVDLLVSKLAPPSLFDFVWLKFLSGEESFWD